MVRTHLHMQKIATVLKKEWIQSTWQKQSIKGSLNAFTADTVWLVRLTIALAIGGRLGVMDWDKGRRAGRGWKGRQASIQDLEELFCSQILQTGSLRLSPIRREALLDACRGSKVSCFLWKTLFCREFQTSPNQALWVDSRAKVCWSTSGGYYECFYISSVFTLVS